MQVGILVRSESPGWASQNLNGGVWQGTVVIPGGWSEQLSSDEDDDGMASFAQPGDEIQVPAADLPVDAPSDDGSDPPAVVIARGVVSVP